MNSFLSVRRKCDGRGFHARRSSIDGCALLKGRTSDGNWTSKGHWMLLPASTSDDDHEKVERVRIMKEIPNGAENTGNSARPGFPLFSLLFLHPASPPPLPHSRLHDGLIVTGLGSFAAAVGSTRWVTVTPSSSPRMEQRKAQQLVAFTSNLGKNARKSRELALPKCGWGVYSELWVVDPPGIRFVMYLRRIPEVILLD